MDAIEDPTRMTGARSYMAAVRRQLDAVESSEAGPIDQAADLCAAAIRADRQIYLFGTGHSHMLAEEGHFRAGGLAAVCPILASPLMLHEGAVASSQFERTADLAEAILDRYPIGNGDVAFVFSNSGVNTVPVEAAAIMRDRGAKVVAVLSTAYAAHARPGPSGRRLSDMADIVIDNHGPPGDALVAVPDTEQRAGPGSTIAAAFILNAILVEAVVRTVAAGQPAPVYLSANMPGAKENNAGLIDRYRRRNPHL